MKKYLSIFCIITLFTLLGCNNKKGLIETINQEMQLNLANTANEGALDEFYEYTYYPPDGIKEAIKIKGIIDKTLEMLPTKTEERQFNMFNEIFDYYKWETPQQEVQLQCTWKKNFDDPEKRNIYIRIWIYNK